MITPEATRAFRGAVLAAALTVSGLASGQSDQGAWELRVCAPPNTMPFSESDGSGFENRIAAVLAEEMGAELTFDWHPFTADLIDRRFSEGTCDVIMGVPDGAENTLNTITYYQSPYVLVHRADAGFRIESMDDPVLAELRIGVQGLATPPHEALLARGLTRNVTTVFGNEEGEARLASMVEAVAAGQVDVGFGWGPVVGYYAARHEADLVVSVVEPVFDLPSIFQFQPMTIGVRPGDTAMQARLNRAIAARWDEISAILDEYDVPQMPSARPQAGALPDLSRHVRVGVILPVPTGARTYEARIYNLIGEAARRGAVVAESIASQGSQPGQLGLHVLYGSSPSPEAAARQAAAMTALGEVDALVGGVGAGQAEVIGRIAADAGIPFINIGSPSLDLRRQCLPTTFSVHPPAITWLDAMIRQYRLTDGPMRWFAVYEDHPEGRMMLEALEVLSEAAGDRLVGSAGVEKNLPVYLEVLAGAEEAQADAVIILLDPADQLAMMGQAEDAGYSLVLAPYPDPLTQTREFLAASKEYGVGLRVPRLQLWDAALSQGLAGRLNENYGGQWGQPLDAPAWAAIAGVSVLAEAARLADSAEPEALMDALFQVDVGALSGKAPDQFFRPDNRELPQELYAIAINLDNDWRIRLSTQVNAGTLIGTMPAAGLEYGITCN